MNRIQRMSKQVVSNGQVEIEEVIFASNNDFSKPAVGHKSNFQSHMGNLEKLFIDPNDTPIGNIITRPFDKLGGN